MSAVSYHLPKQRLAELLRAPGGLPVAEAVQRAAANLGGLAASCVAEVGAALEKAEACLARFPASYDEQPLMELYDIAGAQIGVPSVCGLDAIDTALHSLCELLDHLRIHQRWDMEAVTVHVRAIRLLLHTEGARDAAGTEAILTGLRQVSRRYAPPAEEAAL